MRTIRYLLWVLQPDWHGQLMEDEEMGASGRHVRGDREGGMRKPWEHCRLPPDAGTLMCGYESLSPQAKLHPNPMPPVLS